MARNPRRQDQELQALYDRLPNIDCQGLCHDSCGPIHSSLRERTRVERAAGRELTCGFGPSCSMLTATRRCSVYEIRPLICRLWGLTRSMKCPYGCKPDRTVEDDEAMFLLHEADRIGDVPTRRDEEIVHAIELQKRVLDEEILRVNAKQLGRKMIQRPTLAGRHDLSKSIFEISTPKGSR